MSCTFNWALRHEDILGELHSFFKHGTRWSWVVGFTPLPLYHQGKSPWHPLDRRLGGPQSRSGRGGEEKNSQPLPGFEPPVIQPVPRSYTTEIAQLLIGQYDIKMLKLSLQQDSDILPFWNCFCSHYQGVSFNTDFIEFSRREVWNVKLLCYNYIIYLLQLWHSKTLHFKVI
jgi:hypothetical protein